MGEKLEALFFDIGARADITAMGHSTAARAAPTDCSTAYRLNQPRDSPMAAVKTGSSAWDGESADLGKIPTERGGTGGEC